MIAGSARNKNRLARTALRHPTRQDRTHPGSVAALRCARQRLAAAGADLDGLEIPRLRQHYLPPPRQFQPGDERAGPGGAPAQPTPDIGLGIVRRQRQQAGERCAVRRCREQKQDALARRRDVMEFGQRRPMHVRRVRRRVVVEQRQARPEELDDVDLVSRFERRPEQLRLAAGEDVEADLGPALQPVGQRRRIPQGAEAGAQPVGLDRSRVLGSRHRTGRIARFVAQTRNRVGTVACPN